MQQIRYVLFDFFSTLVDYTSSPASLPEMYQPLADIVSDRDLLLFDKANGPLLPGLFLRTQQSLNWEVTG